MKIIVRSFVALAMLITAATVAHAEDSEHPLPAPPTPGRFSLTIKSGDVDRLAHIQIPADYKPDAKPPLVLLLHGAGGSGAAMLDHDGWSAKVDKEGFIAIAPDGLPALLHSPASFIANPRLWNYGQLPAGSARAAIDDAAFIRHLLDALKDKIPYDESRVFCAGHSNGGGMTFRLASDMPERFTAIGIVAGTMAAEFPKPKKPLPTLFILGTKDPFVPIDGGEVKVPFGSRQNPPVAEPLAAWAKNLGCATEPKTISDKDGVSTVEYPSPTNGPTLTVIYIEGQGHNWPGGKHPLPESRYGPTTDKLDATNALWGFFKANDSRSAK